MIQALIDQLITTTTAVGITVGVIDQGKIEYYFSGKPSVQSEENVSKDHIFEIGSISKVFTGLLMVEFLKDGKIALDDPIEDYLKGIKIPQKNGKKITFRHLATHTSGLPKLPTNFHPQDKHNPYPDYDKHHLYEFLESYELLREPGEKYEYSNVGMALLGHILSVIEEKPFDELVHDKILRNLGMKNSAVFNKEISKDRLARGHHVKSYVKNWDFSIFAPAGSICSNIEDMTLFLAANMGMINTVLFDSMNHSHQQMYELNEGYLGLTSIGFGWHISNATDGEIIWHNGGTGGYRSFMGFNPKTQKGVVILSNSTEEIPTELGFHLLDSDLYKLNEQKASSLPIDGKKLEGIYELFIAKDQPKQTLKIEYINHQLVISHWCHPVLMYLEYEGDHSFHLRGASDYKFQFILEDQKVKKMIYISPDGKFIGALQIEDDKSEKSVFLDNNIQKFYETGVEKDRLNKNMGRLEKERTDKLLSQYLPRPPAKILDVGGGVGIYAFDLARKGYHVYLIDPVLANIEEAKKLGKDKNTSLDGYIVGDARNIEMSDESVDVVLFMGPLYHLNSSDRKIALSEAYRVLKPDGKLFAVAISRFCNALGSFVKGQMEDPDFEKAVFNSLEKGYYFYKGGLFFSHWPQELENEIQDVGFENVSLHAIQGFGFCLDNRNWDDENLRKKLLKVIELTEKETSVLGISDHLMAISQKPK